MSKIAMSTLEVLACLLNGAHIVWRQKVGPGSDTFRVYMPGGRDPDNCIGRITGATIACLWERGFLACDEPSTTDKTGDRLYVVRLDKPKMPFQEVPSNE